MADFIEFDFIEAGDKGSGDAIAVRHRQGAFDWVYIVDGGYSDDGQKLLDHIRAYYDKPSYIDHVVLTHSDGDHAAGLETVLTDYEIKRLWMNRPWQHVDELMPKFKYYQDRERLIARLKRDFPKVAELEQIADDIGIEINDVFCGATIGVFTVLSPSKTTYLDLIVESDKTPVPATKMVAKLAEDVSAAAWGEENLKGDTEGTSEENETSVVQFAEACGKKILLTGDAGVRALNEGYDAAVAMGRSTSELDWFQVPHHGSRRNLSSEVLDVWLGNKLPAEVESPTTVAIVSANRNDKEHPKKAVVRALIHRGRRVVQTEGILSVSTKAAPDRGWTPAIPLTYPTDQDSPLSSFNGIRRYGECKRRVVCELGST